MMSLFPTGWPYHWDKAQHFMNQQQALLETQIDIAQRFLMTSHVIAAAVRAGLEVQTVDGVNISVVFTVKLFPIATVDPYCPKLIHLTHHTGVRVFVRVRIMVYRRYLLGKYPTKP